MLDIDANISTYGVKSPKLYMVSSREIMGQAVAGKHGAGEEWSYDSYGNFWINRMVSVFEKATERKPSQVWESEFHKPLGLSSSFTWDNADEAWAYGSVGTARDYARVGQLMLNRGKWRKESEEYELVSEAFIQQVSLHDCMGCCHTRVINLCLFYSYNLRWQLRRHASHPTPNMPTHVMDC